MTSIARRGAGRALGCLALAAILLLAGCQRVTIDVTVDPDGTGMRSVTLARNDDKDNGESAFEGVRALYGVDAAAGWEPVLGDRPADGGPAPLEGYRREQRIERLADWAGASGDFRLRGSLEDEAFADVQLANAVVVETGSTAAAETYTYRETLAWTDLKEAIVAYLGTRFVQEIQREFGPLGAERAAELRGLMAGQLLGVWSSLVSDDDVTRQAAEASALGDLTPQVARVLGPASVDGGEARIRDILSRVIGDEDDNLGRFLERSLPGADVSILTTVEVNLSLPGRVVDSNADAIEDGRARWDIELAEAFRGPIELYARSEVPR